MPIIAPLHGSVKVHAAAEAKKLDDIKRAIDTYVPGIWNELEKAVKLFLTELQAVATDISGPVLHFVLTTIKDAVAEMSTNLGLADATTAGAVAAFDVGGLAAGAGLGEIGVEFFGTIADFFLDVVEKPLLLAKDVRPGDEEKYSRKAYQAAFIAGEIAHALGALAEIIHPLKTMGLDKMAAAMVDLADFGSVSKARIGPLLDTHITIPARYAAMAKARPVLPDQGRLNELLARRLITEDQWTKNVPYSGIAPDWENPMQETAYRAVQPFILAGGLGVIVEDKAPLVELLRFGGYREKDIPTLLTAMENRTLNTLRNAVITEAVTLTTDGLYSDAELASLLATID